MMIDGDKLTAWLTEQKKAWADLVVGFLPEFEVERTPIDKISVPTSTRLRHNDPGTSWNAAIAQTPAKSQKLYVLMSNVFSIMDNYTNQVGMTDPELIKRLRLEYPGGTYTDSGVRTRRAELRDAGWIVDSGVKRENHIVWEWVK